MRTLMLGAGDRLWNAAGLSATVTEAGLLGVWAVTDGDRESQPLMLGQWRYALTCEYCDHPAELQLIDGQDGDVLCRCCARVHFDQPTAWARPIPRAVIRRLYSTCTPLKG